MVQKTHVFIQPKHDCETYVFGSFGINFPQIGPRQRFHVCKKTTCYFLYIFCGHDESRPYNKIHTSVYNSGNLCKFAS